MYFYWDSGKNGKNPVEKMVKIAVKRVVFTGISETDKHKSK